MHPRELIAQGVPLQIEMASDNYRLLAALVEHPKGWIFADIGWCDPLCSFHAPRSAARIEIAAFAAERL